MVYCHVQALWRLLSVVPLSLQAVGLLQFVPLRSQVPISHNCLRQQLWLYRIYLFKRSVCLCQPNVGHRAVLAEVQACHHEQSRQQIETCWYHSSSHSNSCSRILCI